MWLEQYDEYDLESLEYFKYPTTGLGYGSNLHDTLSPPYPFVNLVQSYPLDNEPYTVYDMLAATFPTANCPYRYVGSKVEQSVSKRSLSTQLFADHKQEQEQEQEGVRDSKESDGGGVFIFLLFVCVPAGGFLIACMYPQEEKGGQQSGR